MINDQERRIISALILWGACTGQQLAREFDADREAVLEMMRDLQVRGVVRTESDDADGDLCCSACGLAYLENAETHVGDICGGGRWSGRGFCGYTLIDDCRWVYCGGPISQALAA